MDEPKRSKEDVDRQMEAWRSSKDHPTVPRSLSWNIKVLMDRVRTNGYLSKEDQLRYDRLLAERRDIIEEAKAAGTYNQTGGILGD